MKGINAEASLITQALAHRLPLQCAQPALQQIKNIIAIGPELYVKTILQLNYDSDFISLVFFFFFFFLKNNFLKIYRGVFGNKLQNKIWVIFRWKKVCTYISGIYSGYF